VCTTRLKVYITNFKTYILIIGMDWLETHRAFVDYFEKSVLCLDNERRSIEIHDIKMKVSLCFILTMKSKCCMRQGGWLYILEVVSDGYGSSLDQYTVLSKFEDVFPKEFPRLPP
jgi:hypothetical protein